MSLLVKHVETSVGRETIYPANKVEFCPISSKGQDPNSLPNQNTVCVYGPEAFNELSGGTVYVMNSEGKTISKYILTRDEPLARCWPHDPTVVISGHNRVFRDGVEITDEVSAT
jgi:hypothetical protein